MSIVDLMGVLGFALSLVLALAKVLSNRLRVKASEFVLIDAPAKIPESIFLVVTLSNKISLPFSLVSMCLRDQKKKEYISFEPTVRTYAGKETKEKLEVKPVVLSQAFPVRFDAYDAKWFLLELPRQHTSSKLLLRDGLAHSQEGPQQKLRLLRRLSTRRPRFQLMLRTSRGRRAIPIQVVAVRGWGFLEAYAVRKAAHEEKIVFP